MRITGVCGGIFALVIVFAMACPLQAGASRAKIAEWRDLLSGDDAASRSMAALALLDPAASGDEEAVDSIRQGLGDTERPAIHLSILNAIALKADDRFIPEIVPLLNHPDTRVVEAASAALAAQKSRRAIDEMLQALRDPLQPALVRCELARIVGEMRLLGAVPALIDLLGADEAPLQAAALASLEKLTVQFYGFDRDAWSKWWQEQQGRPREIMLEGVVRTQAETIRRLSDQLAELWVKLLSAQDLAKDPRALTEALASGLPTVQVFAAKKIAELRPQGSVATLIPYLNSPEGQVRATVAQALGEVGDVQASRPLISLLEDEEPKVAAAAANALGRLKAADAAPALLGVLRAGGAEAAGAAARALGDIGAQQAIPALSDALLNEKLEGPVREEAAAALGKLNDAAALPALVASLGDPDDRIRWAVADGLGRLGYAESVPALGETLKSDKDPRVREVAALSLGKMRSQQAVAYLLSGVDDVEPRVAEQSLAALMGILGTNVENYAKLTDDLVQKGENAKAARLCQAALDKIAKEAPHADTAAITRRLGIALANAGKWSDARKPLEKALETPGGDDTLLYAKLTECYVQAGELETAADLGARAVRKFPGEAATLSDILAPALESLFEERKIEPVVRFINAFTPEAFAALPPERRDQLASLKERCERMDEIVAKEIAALVAASPEDQNARTAAVRRLVALGEKAAPYLVGGGLGSSDARIQDASMEALAKITGRSFGLGDGATTEQKQNAIKAWMEWWQKERPGGSGPSSISSPQRASPAKRS